MTHTAEQVVQALNFRKAQNVEFFKEQVPALFQIIDNRSLKASSLNVSPDGSKINLIVNGKPFYLEDYRLDGAEEAKQFVQINSYDKVINSVKLPRTENFKGQRYFHRLAAEFCRHSPINDLDQVNMKIPGDHYPLVVVMGIGLGGHLEALLNTSKIKQLLIFERDPEIFFASLFTFDWISLFKERTTNPDKSLHIFIAEQDSEHNVDFLHKQLWSRLLELHPLFPSASYFLNHRGDAINTSVLQKIKDDIPSFDNTWGFYDDELNQLNQTLHTLNNQNRLLSASITDTPPVFIVASGPSLDKQLDTIKLLQDKAIIVSSGTGLKPLHKAGITPHYHVEVESHIITAQVIESLGDPDWLKKITLICPTQVHPEVPRLFKDTLVYFKKESFTPLLVPPEKRMIIWGGTPTCTNAAFAVFQQTGFKNIFLFGCDFGFKTNESHHSIHSENYSDTYKKITNNFKIQGSIKTKDIYGNDLMTTPIYYTAKRTIEFLMEIEKARGVNLYNCSDGADIKNSQILNSDELAKMFESFEPVSVDFKLNGQDIVDENYAKNSIKVLSDNMDKLIEEAIKIVEMNFGNVALISIKIMKLLKVNYVHPEFTHHYWFIRGSIWHILSIFYRHSLCLDDQDSINKMNLLLAETLDQLRIKINEDLTKMKNKSEFDNDPMSNCSVTDLPAGEHFSIAFTPMT